MRKSLLLVAPIWALWAAPLSAGTQQWLMSDDTQQAYQQGRLEDALTFGMRDLKACKASQPKAEECLMVTRFLSYVARDMRQWVPGEIFARSAVDLSEKHLSPTDPDRARSYTALAEHLTPQKKFVEAEALLRKAYELRIATLGKEDENSAISAINLADLLTLLGRFEETEPLYRASVEIRRIALGPNDPATGYSLMGWAYALTSLGRYPEAESASRAATEILIASRGEKDVTSAAAFAGLANILSSQGRYAEAEVAARRALNMRLAAVGEMDPYVAFSYGQVASMLRGQGRLVAAEKMARESLRIGEAFLGNKALDVASFATTLAHVLADQGKYQEAAPLYERALGKYRNAYGDSHFEVAKAEAAIAANLRDWGKVEEAIQAFRQALATANSTLGAGHETTATMALALGELLLKSGDHTEARPLLAQALVAFEAKLPPSHPRLIVARGQLGLAELRNPDQKASGVAQLRRAAEALTERTRRAGIDDMAKREFDRFRGIYFAAAEAEWTASGGIADEGQIGRAFEAAQWAMTNEAAGALAKLSASYSRSGNGIGQLEAERSAKIRQRDAAEARYLQLFGKDEPELRRLRDESGARRDAAVADIASIEAAIGEKDPGYQDLTRPVALTLQEARALLQPDEALTAMLVTADATYIFAITRKAVAWSRAGDLGFEVLSKRIGTLRQSMVQDLITGTESFDASLAHDLYRQLLQPVEHVLEGKSTLLVAGNGPLTAFPLQILVTEAPTSATSDATAMAGTNFLVDRFAIANLPAVSSLRALRCLLPPRDRISPGCGSMLSSRAQQAAPKFQLIGIGAPLLAPTVEDELARSAPEYGRAFDGPLADTEFLRSLSSLPGSEAELKSLQKLFVPAKARLLLGADATETQVKTGPELAQARYVIFSTHGLLASESGIAGEPGLVFTPPPADRKSQLDDGFLTASEAAKLKLNADFVVLSACNTAAADGRVGSEGLSGLARSFFFAGARSLLVSHWIVSDEATSALMEGVFKAQEANPANRAAVLQTAIKGLRARPEWASPAYWAPFTLVGTPN